MGGGVLYNSHLFFLLISLIPTIVQYFCRDSYWGSQTRMKIESVELNDSPISLGAEEVTITNFKDSALTPERSTISVANALRDVYDNERLGGASEFLLLFGETVGNVDFKRLIELHR